LNLFLKKTTLLLLVGFISISVIARSNVFPSGGRPAGMGNAFISRFDLSAAYHNQAGLSKIESPSLSLFYENKFLVKEMSFRGVLLGLPTKTANFAIHYSAFGPAKWTESIISVACSKQLSTKLAAGIQLNYFGMKLPEENATESSYGVEMGIIWQPTSKIFVGIHLANPFSVPIVTYSYNEKIPYRIRAGSHTFLSENFIISIEAEKTENVSTIFKLGVEWEAIPTLYFRGGYNSGSTKLFAGLGYQYRFLKTDLAFSYHQYLGFTPSISINFNLK
jgi:hypothetical protein